MSLEIQALKEELEALKTERGSSNSNSIQLSSSSIPPVEGSKEELIAKISSYQKFMADYIVKSNEEKILAVKVAEEKVAEKYEAKMLLLGSSESKESSSESKESSTFDKRNAKVVAAAKAGKSRWGDNEVAKAALWCDSCNWHQESQ